MNWQEHLTDKLSAIGSGLSRVSRVFLSTVSKVGVFCSSEKRYPWFAALGIFLSLVGTYASSALLFLLSWLWVWMLLFKYPRELATIILCLVSFFVMGIEVGYILALILSGL